MDHALVCFRDGTKATKSYVAFCVSQIQQMVQSTDAWPLVMHLIEMSQENQVTTFEQFSKAYIQQLGKLGILKKTSAGYVLQPVFRQVLLEAEQQNTIYTTIYDKLVYNRNPAAKPEVEDGANKPEGIEAIEDAEEASGTEEIMMTLGRSPVFKHLKFQFVYYDPKSGKYSDIEYKPDAEFAIPAPILDYLRTLE